MPEKELDVNSEENIQALMKWLHEEQLPRGPVILNLLPSLAKTAGKKVSWYSITATVENLIKEKKVKLMIFGGGDNTWGIGKVEKIS